jgi:hypothetical protein
VFCNLACLVESDREGTGKCVLHFARLVEPDREGTGKCVLHFARLAICIIYLPV